MDIGTGLKQAAALLADCVETPQLDAEVLLAYVLKTTRVHLFTYPETVLSTQQAADFALLLAKRASGIPIAYLTGQREFWSLNIHVTPDTLIPRPETEKMVSLTLSHLPAGAPVHLLELATGSGAISLALAHERPHWQLEATDFSVAALAVAQSNAKNLSLKNIHFLQSDWFSDILPKEYDAILCNPPYITPLDPHLAMGDVRFEPKMALVADADGLACIRIIVAKAGDFLKPGGLLLLEHGYDQGAHVIALMQQVGFINVCDYCDDAGISRITVGVKPPII